MCKELHVFVVCETERGKEREGRERREREREERERGRRERNQIRTFSQYLNGFGILFHCQRVLPTFKQLVPLFFLPLHLGRKRGRGRGRLDL